LVNLKQEEINSYRRKQEELGKNLRNEDFKNLFSYSTDNMEQRRAMEDSDYNYTFEKNT